MKSECDRCGSNPIINVSAKCSDCFSAVVSMPIGDSLDCYVGYVPDGVGIGGGDYVGFSYCPTCGKIQGKFPLHKVMEKFK